MTPLDLPLLGLAILSRIFVIEPFTIPASSMMPTLEVGDYLLASKSAYGYSQFSTPIGAYLPAFDILKTAPARGDVVLFRLPRDPSTTYIKRVIGIAGDRVQVIGGIVHVNGKALEREQIFDSHGKNNDYAGVSIYLESAPGTPTYEIMEKSDDSNGDNTQEFLVPPGHCFVMGDNRDNSLDSRYEQVGFVPYANVFAKALITVDFDGPQLRAHAVK